MEDMRWGRLSDEEKALDTYAPDPDASALVLGDVAEGRIKLVGSGFRMEIKRHRRVKVFGEGGYDLGEFVFRYNDDDDLRAVKGQTFVPQPDGSYERVRLDGDAIFREEVRDGVEEIRFSMPALAPGAIFEFEYVFESGGLFRPPTWFFQSEEPTLYSAYRFTAPEFFDYVLFSQGSRIQTEQTELRYRGDWEEATFAWSARDVPALREEPYTTSEADYVHKVELQLSRVQFPNRIPEQVLSSWEKVAEELDGDDDFGGRMRARGDLADLARSVEGTPSERAEAIYDLVRTGYVWNGRRGIYADRRLRDVAETKTGSAPEINLLLLALLREAGVPAEPLLISTRSNGRIIRQYPIVTRFNHVLVLAEPEGGPAQILDATDPHRPYGMPPVEALTGEAWVANPDAPTWIEFGSPGATSTTTSIQGTLSADGTLQGDLGLRLAGYDALRLRTRLAEDDADAPSAEATAAAASEAADAEEGLDIDAVTVEGLDDAAEAIRVRAEARGQAAEVEGDEIYFSPFVVMRMEENPFKRAEREFPVDFAYPFKRTYVATFQLPEGYELESVPAPLQVTIPSQSVVYTRRFASAPGQLQVQSVLDVAASAISPDEYGALRSLYDDIVGAEAEAVVLVRTETAPPASGAAPEGESTPEPGQE